MAGGDAEGEVIAVEGDERDGVGGDEAAVEVVAELDPAEAGAEDGRLELGRAAALHAMGELPLVEGGVEGELGSRDRVPQGGSECVGVGAVFYAGGEVVGPSFGSAVGLDDGERDAVSVAGDACCAHGRLDRGDGLVRAADDDVVGVVPCVTEADGVVVAIPALDEVSREVLAVGARLDALLVEAGEVAVEDGGDAGAGERGPQVRHGVRSAVERTPRLAELAVDGGLDLGRVPRASVHRESGFDHRARPTVRDDGVDELAAGEEVVEDRAQRVSISGHGGSARR